ncbi:MAG: alanine racemase [Oscillospiraceae bacterium]|nr:alanine racemase [Oscillospiraceae bacterium]
MNDICEQNETQRAWAEIHLEHLAHNYRALRACAPEGCRFLAPVKANAYGHGVIPVAQQLAALGADYLAVACLTEAQALRAAGIRAPILILGYTDPAQVPALLAGGITQTVISPAHAAALSRAAGQAGGVLRVHCKADTGMTRLGFFCGTEEAAARAAADLAGVCALPGLEVEGIFTHFADADGSERYTMEQFSRFLALREALRARGLTGQIWHCAASAAVLKYPCTHLDMIRPGIALYGHFPAPDMEHLLPEGLRPVMTLKARVADVREIPAGVPVSYGRTHTLARASRLAVLTIGYADGLPRLCSNRLSVALGGGMARIAGRVCMDMCMVDVTDLPGVRAGDAAEIYGAHAPVERAAEIVDTISYELLCAVSARVPRVIARQD